MLKEFYAKAAEATAFVQQKAEPEIFDKAYTGMGGESGGVVGMLEVSIRIFYSRGQHGPKLPDTRSTRLRPPWGSLMKNTSAFSVGMED